MPPDASWRDGQAAVAYHTVGSDERESDWPARHGQGHASDDSALELRVSAPELNITEVRITGGNHDDPIFSVQERGGVPDVRGAGGADANIGGRAEVGQGTDTSDDLGVLPLSFPPPPKGWR